MAFGDDETQLGDYAWYAENSESKTHPVVTKKPNAFDHYDMHGNVWQWVEDRYHACYEEAPSDRSAWVKPCSIIRVVRGGSRFGILDFHRSAFRHGYLADSREDDLGFRVGKTLTP